MGVTTTAVHPVSITNDSTGTVVFATSTCVLASINYSRLCSGVYPGGSCGAVDTNSFSCGILAGLSGFQTGANYIQSGWWGDFLALNNNNYYLLFGFAGSGGNLFYFPYSKVGGTYYATTTSDIPTAIYSFAYSTSTRIATVTGYMKATTTPNITERLYFYQGYNELYKSDFTQVIATTTGTFSFSFNFTGALQPYAVATTTQAIISPYTLFYGIDQYDNSYYDPYGSLGLDRTRYITNLVASSTTIQPTQYNATGIITPIDLATYPEYECSITSMTGCIKNALISLFYPTREALDQYNSFIALLQSKAPIGYFYNLRYSIGGISASSTPAFAITLPAHIKSTILNPFDIGIASIIWFWFAMNFYKRLKHITI